MYLKLLIPLFARVFLAVLICGGVSAEVAKLKNKSPKSYSVYCRVKLNGVFLSEKDFRVRLCILVNEARSLENLSPLKLKFSLIKAAQGHAEDMLENDTLTHEGSSEEIQTVPDRLNRQGVQFTTWAENIAVGDETPEQVIRTWLNSPPHRANILKADIHHFGVGKAELYWAQVFTD